MNHAYIVNLPAEALTWKTYQEGALYTLICEERDYLFLGLLSEVGELAGVYKKKIRDNTDETTFNQKRLGECGDILYYVAVIAQDLGIDLGQVFAKKKKSYEPIVDEYVELLSLMTDNSHEVTSSCSRTIIKHSLNELLNCIVLALPKGVSLAQLAKLNLEKLYDRKERGVIKGSGDNR